MNNRNNHLLIGAALLAFGVFLLLQTVLGLRYLDIMLGACGMAFLLLYRTKKKSWSLVAGSYLLYIGAAGILGQLHVNDVLPGIFAAMFFIVPGIIFMVLYYEKHKYGLIVPGALLLWLGLYVILLEIPGLRVMGASLFFLCFGGAFLTMYGLGRAFIGKFPLYAGTILCAAGLLVFVNFGFHSLVDARWAFPGVTAALAIAGGMGLLVHSWLKNRRKQ